ncbi:hypothetical protein FHS95_000009 [Sphingomonas naasensis]|uniref:Uncharacterized protein n=1 Tax=Sphingomonas naasensis TaxID=1344951 RepID=A0A4S1WQI3_9SPHN|nr:hypothetical protein [Sphingomonas naasensis]NIJ18340.1 hypothetical protein [Sphingomonas naasensis]TGX45611.1 hypothetical protein E5A74_00050 [Sphingomonas naasensis]
MSAMVLIALLLALPQDFNPTEDRERTAGDSWLARASEWNRDPEPSLASVNGEAMRFSATPALRGGEAIIVTIVPDRQGDAMATIGVRKRTCYDDRATGCRLVASRSAPFAFCIEGDCSYHRIAQRVRALLFDPARMRQPGGEPVICMDGPGYLTEFREVGQTYNLSGFCGERHPNNVIYQIVRQGAGKHWPQTPYLE